MSTQEANYHPVKYHVMILNDYTRNPVNLK